MRRVIGKLQAPLSFLLSLLLPSFLPAKKCRSERARSYFALTAIRHHYHRAGGRERRALLPCLHPTVCVQKNILARGFLPVENRMKRLQLREENHNPQLSPGKNMGRQSYLSFSTILKEFAEAVKMAIDTHVQYSKKLATVLKVSFLSTRATRRIGLLLLDYLISRPPLICIKTRSAFSPSLFARRKIAHFNFWAGPLSFSPLSFSPGDFCTTDT